jgi:hypothetical protein
MNCESCKSLKKNIVKKGQLTYDYTYCKKYGEILIYYIEGKLEIIPPDKCIDKQKLKRLKEILK